MPLPPGVPNLLNGVNVAFVAVENLLAADSLIGYGLGAPPAWGLFEGGQPVIIADTVTSFGYQQDWAIADYPVERGGFESYDKVNTPYRIHVQFVSGGSVAKREALLSSISRIGDLLTLYDVLTPEEVYVGVNVEGYRYKRTAANGLGLMIVEVQLLEIRQEGITDYKNTKAPSGYAASPSGNVQAVQYQNAPFSAGGVT